jgi:hypothetical protein
LHSGSRLPHAPGKSAFCAQSRTWLVSLLQCNNNMRSGLGAIAGEDKEGARLHALPCRDLTLTRLAWAVIDCWIFFAAGLHGSVPIPTPTIHAMSDSEAEGGVPLIEAEFDTTASSKKRKAEAEPEDVKDSKKAAKKAKRKEKKKLKAKEIDEDDLDQELGVNHAFERMDGQLLADYVNSRTRLYGKELSSVELEDKFIPGTTLGSAQAIAR